MLREPLQLSTFVWYVISIGKKKNVLPYI